MSEKITKIIGKVLPTPKGTWSASKMYDKLDFVTYKGSGYVSLKATDDKRPISEVYWEHVFIKGEWDEHKNYTLLEVVTCAGQGYYKKLNDLQPSEDISMQQYWTKVMMRGEWSATAYNIINDLRTYNGKTYLCISNNFSIIPDTPNNTCWVEVNMRNEWLSYGIYRRYDVVSYDTNLFVKNKSEQPVSDENYWTPVNLKGTWSEDTCYEIKDVVSYDGLGYMCKKSTSSHAPINSNNWTLVCEKGETGDKGERGEIGVTVPKFIGTWSKENMYMSFDVVYYKGSSYLCNRDHSAGIYPDMITWKSTDKNPTKGTWSDETKYDYEDIVEHNGKFYMCNYPSLINIEPGMDIWTMICKGFDYDINENDEIIFRDKSISVEGEHVHMSSRKNLEETITELKNKLDTCLNILKKYNLD